MRLDPITKGRAKAAVPFAGGYRLADFVLSNLVNSGIQPVYVLSQFNNGPLLRHLAENWRPAYGDIRARPERTHRGEQWFSGTADAVYQNLHLLDQASPEAVAVFGADHVYQMDIRQMLAYHRSRLAAGTISALPVPVSQASRFGTMEVDSDWRVIAFHEKVARPPEIPGRPGWALASMGNYLFQPHELALELCRDASDTHSEHDFGHNVLPRMIHRVPIFAYDFASNSVPGDLAECRGYWRDVGTVRSYYEANMEMLPQVSAMRLRNPRWPVREGADLTVDGASAGNHIEPHHDWNSIISRDCAIEAGAVHDSVLGRNVVVEKGAEVRESILMDNCRIRSGAKICQAIVDEGVNVDPGTRIGGPHNDAGLLYLGRDGIERSVGQRDPISLRPARAIRGRSVDREPSWVQEVTA